MLVTFVQHVTTSMLWRETYNLSSPANCRASEVAIFARDLRHKVNKSHLGCGTISDWGYQNWCISSFGRGLGPATCESMTCIMCVFTQNREPDLKYITFRRKQGLWCCFFSQGILNVKLAHNRPCRPEIAIEEVPSSAFKLQARWCPCQNDNCETPEGHSALTWLSNDSEPDRF